VLLVLLRCRCAMYALQHKKSSKQARATTVQE
jgi:hypothetical protein